MGTPFVATRTFSFYHTLRCQSEARLSPDPGNAVRCSSSAFGMCICTDAWNPAVYVGAKEISQRQSRYMVTAAEQMPGGKGDERV